MACLCADSCGYSCLLLLTRGCWSITNASALKTSSSFRSPQNGTLSCGTRPETSQFLPIRDTAAVTARNNPPIPSTVEARRSAEKRSRVLTHTHTHTLKKQAHIRTLHTHTHSKTSTHTHLTHTHAHPRSTHTSPACSPPRPADCSASAHEPNSCSPVPSSVPHPSLHVSTHRVTCVPHVTPQVSTCLGCIRCARGGCLSVLSPWYESAARAAAAAAAAAAEAAEADFAALDCSPNMGPAAVRPYGSDTVQTAPQL